MRPTYIDAVDFQGATFQYDLAPITVFQGNNDSGKTRVLNAIKYALLDYIPKLGKQPVKLKKLMSANAQQTMVTLAFDDNTTIQRGLKIKAEGDAARIKLKAPDWEIPSIMFDFSEFLQATLKEQIQMIFDRVAQQDLTFDEKSFLAALFGIEVTPAAECQKAITELRAILERSIKRRSGAKQSIQDWLTGLLRDLEDERKKFSILADQASSQMIGLRPQGVSPKSSKEEITKAETELATAYQKRTELQTKQKTIAATSRRKNELETIIASPPADNSENCKFANSLSKEIAKYKSDTQSIEAKITLKQGLITPLSNKLKELNAASIALEKEVADLEHRVSCPYCKSKRKDWKEEYVADLSNRQKELRTELDCVNSQLPTLTKEKDALIADLEKSKLRDIDINSKRKKLLDLNTALATHQTKLAEFNSAKSELAGITQTAGSVDSNEIESVLATIDRLEKLLSTLKKDEATFQGFQQNKEKLLSTEKDLITLQAKVAVFKKAGAMVLDEQEKIVSSAFTPIITTARKFTDGILPGALDYRDGELGMVTGAGFISHEVMATMSQTLAYIGIAIALAQQSPTKIIILDEAGIIDAERKPKVLERLLFLIREKVIDAVFMADPTTVGYEKAPNSADFSLIRLM